MAGNPTTPLPSVRVLWRPEQFNRVTNGTFETNTTGWATTAGINAAATSITRITTDFHSGAACASVVCTATDTSGVNYDLGSDRYYAEATYGSIYVVTGWVKRVSGSKRLRVTLGSLGTSSDRATLTITDLLDAWQPFVIRWLPTANRTDVELAVTNGSAEALTFRLDDVKVYAVDAFSQVENGFFPVNTTGWDIAGTGSIALAATSLTHTTTDGFAAQSQTCAELLTTTTSGSGAEYSLGTRTFLTGRTYRFRVALKRKASGLAGTAKLTFGSRGTAGDRATATVTTSNTGNVWQWHTVDWSPSADRTDAAIAITNSAANSTNPYIDHAEVYEAVDDLGTDVETLRWSRSLDGIGTINVRVEDADGAYHPRNTSATLYGSLAPGKRIWGRATYSSALYPLFYGTLTTIEPPQLGGIHTDLNAEDVMASLGERQHGSRFYPDASYATARARALGAALTGNPRSESTSLGASRYNLTTLGTESSNLYAGTDDLVSLSEYLGDMNEATQSAHYAKPSVHANIGWRYTTVDRATLTDTSSDFTVDEDFEDFTGVRFTHEAYENQQVVPWQAFEMGPLAADHFWDDGLDRLAGAIDRDTAAGYGLGSDDENPYMHFYREVYGDNSDVPEPSYRERRIWVHRWGKNGRKKGRKLVRRARRIYPDRFVPFSMVAGDSKTVTIEFAMPIHSLSLGTFSTPTEPTITFIERSPMRVVAVISAEASITVLGVEAYGIPYTPQDEEEVQRNSGTDPEERGRPGPGFSTPYIPSAGAAEGVADHRNWRYASPRMRPTLVDHNTFPRSLTAEVTNHLTVSADRWRVDALLFVSIGCSWEVTQKGMDWRSWHALEELPTHTDWFTLDDAAKGLDDAVVLAY